MILDGKIINEYSENGMEGMDWTDLAQDRDRWPALRNAIMNLWVP